MEGLGGAVGFVVGKDRFLQGGVELANTATDGPTTGVSVIEVAVVRRVPFDGQINRGAIGHGHGCGTSGEAPFGEVFGNGAAETGGNFLGVFAVQGGNNWDG